MSAEKRQWMREALYRLPLAQVKTIRPSGNVRATTEAIDRAAVQAKALGSSSSDLVYFPFTPCRFIDTRNVGGKITGARGFDFFVTGATYGGAAACNLLTLVGVPTGNEIAAIALNMTIVDTSTAASPGFATARPAGATGSTALVNWTVSSAGFQLGNAAVVSTDQGTATDELEIFTSGAVHAIVDFNGAFAAPTATLLDCLWVSSTTPMPTANTYYTRTNTCSAAYLLTGGGCWFSSVGNQQHMIVNSPALADLERTWFCGGKSDVANDTLHGYARCCRIPGR
jgi:hypothetical protein